MADIPPNQQARKISSQNQEELDKDCLQCKIIGVGGLTIIGSLFAKEAYYSKGKERFWFGVISTGNIHIIVMNSKYFVSVLWRGCISISRSSTRPSI
jgi:hypothetical protein